MVNPLFGVAEPRDDGSCAIAAMEPGQIPAVGEILSRAFRDNALNRAVIASEDPERRLDANRHGMRALLPVAREFGRVLTASSDGALSGALLSSPPDRYPLPAPGWLPRLRCLVGQGWRVARRWGDVFDELHWLHPCEPHWYLATLGVDPDHQRRGVGTALLDTWLVEVDRDGLPAYLETDSAANLAFYGRAGFAVVNQIELLGVGVFCLERPPH